MRLGLECRQDFGGIFRVVERQCGSAVGGDHLAERGKTTDGCVAECKKLVREEGGGCEQQHRAAGEQDHRHELAPDRRLIGRYAAARHDVTSSAGRRSFELMERPAALAASALMRSRMRLLSAMNRIITPRCEESSISLTVRMLCPASTARISSMCAASERLMNRIWQCRISVTLR